MHTKDFVVDQGCDWHAVEDILKLFPKSDTVPVLALVIETVNSIDLTAFVVTSQKEKVLLELYLVS